MKIAHGEVTRVTSVQNTEVKGTGFAQGLSGTSMRCCGHHQGLLQSSAGTLGSLECSLWWITEDFLSPLKPRFPVDVEQKSREAQPVLSNVMVMLAKVGQIQTKTHIPYTK